MKLIAMVDKAEVWADQDRIKVFLNSDSKTWDFHPLNLVYILQEYSRYFSLQSPHG